VDFFRDVFLENKNKVAILWEDRSFDYSWLLEKIDEWKRKIEDSGIKPGTVTVVDATFTPEICALIFALIEKECILMPLYKPNQSTKQKLLQISEAEFLFQINEIGEIESKTLHSKSSHPLYKILRDRKHSGLILISSGSSGEPKIVVHDFIPLLEKFRTKRKALRTLNFLLFDHWGGLNTLFHTLSNGGILVFTEDRFPDNICELIQQHKVELLPASPTFLNLLLISESYKKYDLQSLKVISYGTEPMPKSILDKANQVFPNVKIQQTYGLIEVGVLRTKSEKNDSLWMKIGGEGYETRVVDGILQIKSNSTMLGYLNAPSPFTEDGWFITGDRVEVKGQYMRILGRDSEIINVGGKKVYPVEVESVIQEMDGSAEVTVYGEKNPIVGNIVCAKVRLNKKYDENEFVKQLKNHCRKKLQKFKVPVKVRFDEDKQYSYRFKKQKRDSEIESFRH